MEKIRASLMTAKEAARYLRVSMFTLSKIESNGGLVPYRTPGGHRRYSVRMLNRYLNDSRKIFPLPLIGVEQAKQEVKS